LARRLAAATGAQLEGVATEAPAHAAALADGFARGGILRVIARGGDGTITEVAGPLIGTGVVLGIVRGGSGDGLARGLGVPRDPERALAAALSDPPSPIDVGWLGGRHFINIAGIGFDAAVAAAFNRRARRGPAGYVAEVWRTLRSYRCAEYTVRADDFTISGRRLLMAFANGSQYGTGLTIAPDADPSDGALNLVMAAEGPLLLQCWRARRLVWRRLAPARGIDRRLVRRAVVRGGRLICHVDGEPFETEGEFEVTLQPEALRIALPASGLPGTTSGTHRGRLP
jgi:diacylglycerol kinase family enzyme